MAEYIEREAAVKFLRSRKKQFVDDVGKGWNAGVEVAIEAIENLPAEDVVQVWHGRWMEYSGADKGFHYCSECKRQAFNYEENGNIIEALSKWCPNCGALMDGKEAGYAVDRC